MDKSELAKRVVEIALRRGEFKLRSGQISNVYFDKYQFEANPVLLQEIARQMVPLVPAGTKAKLETHEREDYIGKDIVQLHEGRPVMNLVVTRDDGQDCVIYAPTAVGDGSV